MHIHRFCSDSASSCGWQCVQKHIFCERKEAEISATALIIKIAENRRLLLRKTPSYLEKVPAEV